VKLFKTLRWICLSIGLASCAGVGGRFKKIDHDHYAFIKRQKGHDRLLFEIKADSLYDYQE